MCFAPATFFAMGIDRNAITESKIDKLYATTNIAKQICCIFGSYAIETLIVN